MADIRAIDMLFLDGLFEMGGGYVQNFSDRTFAQFFDEELRSNILIRDTARTVLLRPSACAASCRQRTK
jgi:hypothetical protein